MASINPYSRYNSLDNSTSSHFSDPSSSLELKNPNKYPTSSFRTLVRTKSSNTVSTKIKNEQNLSAMVRKFMEKKSKPKTSNGTPLVIPTDFIAEDLKRTAKRGSNFSALQRKLFNKGSPAAEKKALTEVVTNTRTLAMVLKSERELLSQNKEQGTIIAELKLLLEEQNREVEKLKDLCLKQREEIKALKSAILFPDVMNSQLQDILEKQGSELKQAKQVIPSLQRQVTSLTGQLQCLAEDLAEVKGEKYPVKACFESNANSPRTLAYDRETTNSLEFNSGEFATPGSPDEMFVKDLNPCLTPYNLKTKFKESVSELTSYNSPSKGRLRGNNNQLFETQFDSHVKKVSKSSDCYGNSKPVKTIPRAVRRSEESKGVSYGKLIRQNKYFY